MREQLELRVRLINQFIYPKIYNDCLCLDCRCSSIGCNVTESSVYDGEATANPFHGWSKSHNDNDKDNVNDNGLRPLALADFYDKAKAKTISLPETIRCVNQDQANVLRNGY